MSQNASSMFTVPPMVTQNISRARSHIRRNDILRALETLVVAVEMFKPEKIVGKARYETEIHLIECVEDLCKHPTVVGFLRSLSKGQQDPSIKYALGKEAELASTLRVIHKVLSDRNEEIQLMEEDTKELRREDLWEKGTRCIAEGQAPRGKAYLRRMGEEYGREPGVLTRIGEVLVESGLWFEAAEFLEEALFRFHKDSKAYSLLIKAYTTLQEFEKAEALYVKALRQFGQHPTTVINLAKLYRAWNKRDKCFDMAMKAKSLDPGNPEAQDLIDWAERRKK